MSDDLTPLTTEPESLQKVEKVDTPPPADVPVLLEKPEIMNVVMDPDGTTVIEELDTPAIRRAKGMAKKKKKAEESATTKTQESLVDQAVQERSMVLDDISDLTSLSTLEDSDNEEEAPLEKVGKAQEESVSKQEVQREPSANDSVEMELENGDKLEGGTLGKHVNYCLFTLSRLICFQSGRKLVCRRRNHSLYSRTNMDLN